MKRILSIMLLLCLLLSACSTTGSQPTFSPGSSGKSDNFQSAANTNADTNANTGAETAQPSKPPTDPEQTESAEYDYVLEFPSDNYPETALHIYSAIENGHSNVCTIDRDGAKDRRKQSLKGIETREGYDRDEWPMAMCAEGGTGASVAYVNSSDNRGAGSWVGNQLSAYADGEKVLFIVSKPKNLFGKSDTSTPIPNENVQTERSAYKNCAEAHEAGVTPLFEGDPGYSKKLDRDGDGVACEL